MDSSFSNSFLNSKLTYSPRNRQSLSGRPSVSTFKKSSRLSVSARSNQSTHAILKTQLHTVERFGSPLPVLVTEALTFADRNIAVSARLSSECGFAWIVCGRRLLIWQYRQPVNTAQPGTPRRTGLANPCYELQLPQSDLAHRAELISIFMADGCTIPSCIAVSPEGLVRFWPTVVHEGTSIEQQVDLQGQECDSLTGVKGLGCILATTTCTIVVVQPLMHNGRHNLFCKTLKTPSGWLGGISKRMSSLIFGPINTDNSLETRTVRVRCAPTNEPNAWFIYVIAGNSIQKWRLNNNESEQFIYATDLKRLVRDGFYSCHWDKLGGDQSELDVWILDLQPDPNTGNINLLVGGVKHQVSPTIHLAFMSLASQSHAPTEYTSFTVLRIAGHYREENPQESMNYRFILSGNAAYVYFGKGIHVVKSNEEDTLEFNSSQEYILCGSVCVNTPIFFSRLSGLLCVLPNDSDMNASFITPGTPLESSICEPGLENLSVYTFDPVEMSAAYLDVTSQLKAAFIFHIKAQFDACNEIINKHFSSDYVPSVDSNVDVVISSLSLEILDDVPANDPRWDNSQVGLGSSLAMEALEQIENKDSVHGIFVKFLKETELWKRLGALTIDGTSIATTHILADHREKIIAAIALKSKANNDIIQKAIDRAVDSSECNFESGLTKQVVFYNRLTNFHKVLVEMVKIADQAAHSDMNPAESASFIQQINADLLDILNAIANYRQNNKDQFSPSPSALQLAPDYLPWTARSSRDGLLDSLIVMQDLTYNYGIKCVSEYALQTQLYDQLVSLVDFILDARKSHLESIRGSSNEAILLKQYTTDRRKLFAPLVRDEKWDEAALLAEKYLDFESLLLICDKSNNQSRLNMYIDRFSKENFSQFVFNWYMQQNKQDELISLCKSKDTNNRTIEELRVFLSAHPELSLIQNIYDKKMRAAGDTLKKLADIETDSLTRQKTMFSMAKLAKLAAGEDEDSDVIEHIDNRLELIGYQEELPDSVLQQYGYDTLKPCVIEPKDLIHLYTCAEYSDANEVEFKKSLDLLMFITDEELKEELMLHIWKCAILRDSWEDKNLDSPMEVLQNKLMFKIVDLALVLGSDPESLLPPMEKLLSHADLSELRKSKAFEYLIRTGYEHTQNAMKH